ncbi:hypothetical protein HNQ95_003320 [Aminobacter ciceronei]|uniref:Uncharacterized protein n=1 Tax=Aminobacter ciceronei TaxID=150723 RepID=A0ABR6C8M8_9HYPH|nr:hypothetical protein [Aminobacter ciceronei]MBA9021363.1 hypothetical protein [Aminobacter ciceronei]
MCACGPQSRGFVHASCDDNDASIDADLVIHSAGRGPPLDGLNLAASEITTENDRLKLNEYLQSVSNPAIDTAGKSAQIGPPLTPWPATTPRSSPATASRPSSAQCRAGWSRTAEGTNAVPSEICFRWHNNLTLMSDYATHIHERISLCRSPEGYFQALLERRRHCWNHPQFDQSGGCVLWYKIPRFGEMSAHIHGAILRCDLWRSQCNREYGSR